MLGKETAKYMNFQFLQDVLGMKRQQANLEFGAKSDLKRIREAQKQEEIITT